MQFTAISKLFVEFFVCRQVNRMFQTLSLSTSAVKIDDLADRNAIQKVEQLLFSITYLCKPITQEIQQEIPLMKVMTRS